ncbi:TetR/AcrR family transcriptional regulator [Micromonospora sp. NPDC049048]|uniref:TetR/AcrR family transcriptional regulator n=1 Tax=Micromonospora sp. NPDC049048 TaxID=3364263 RepID=UPI0037167AFD
MTTPATGTPEPAGNRSARKRAAILAAAAEVFLRNGYMGASMDEVAATAAVSKQTVYKHFASKERLFTELIESSVGQVDEMFRSAVDALHDTEDLDADLTALARRFVTFVIQPDVMRLRRLVIAEADRFPELGRTFYEQGPQRVTASLADCFAHLHERGLLRVDEPRLAAYQFCWLVLSIPWNRVLFCGTDQMPAGAELEHYATTGVRVFLDAHRPAGQAAGPRSRK